MDAESSQSSEAATLVRVLGDYGQVLSEFCRHRPPGMVTAWKVECKSYETGAVVEIWAEKALRPGYALVWWMDIVPAPDRTWTVACHVSINGEETVRDLGQSSSLSFHEMISVSGRMLSELLAIAP